jgi:superfamily I DNA/RNA helicase
VQVSVAITLDQEQRAAVTHGEGPALVNAGPGSGKTRVLTERVRHLLAQGVPADRIAVCTFTTKAAREMSTRLPGVPVRISTIHGLAWHLLQETYRAQGQPIPEVLSHPTSFVRQIMDRPGDPPHAYPGGLDVLRAGVVSVPHGLEFISRAEDALLRVVSGEQALAIHEAIERGSGGRTSATRRDQAARDLAAVYAAHLRRLVEENRIDFGSMYARLHWMWEDQPLLRTLHARYDHLLVDEFQDTSRGQWEVLRGLCRTRNFFLVGDWDQSMYEFRGADPGVLLSLHQSFPDLRVYNVGTNYRSLPAIVHHAQLVISRESNRPKKDLRAHRTGDAEITLQACGDQEEEGKCVVGQVRRWHGDGRPWSQIAVLSRTSNGLAWVEFELIRTSVPYRTLGTSTFFARAAVQDMVAYLALAQDHTDLAAFSRAITSPNRYLGARFVEGCTALGGDLLAAAGRMVQIGNLRGSQPQQVLGFLSLMEQVEAQDGALAMLRLVRRQTRYDAWAIQHRWKPEDGPQPLSVQELDILEDLAAVVVDPHQLVTIAKQQATPPAESVTLSTIHSAKGLEWDAVAVTGCDEGHMPHACNPNAAEERRVFYVAVTRAREALLLTWPRARTYGDKVLPTKPSRFLSEAGLLRREVR